MRGQEPGDNLKFCRPLPVNSSHTIFLQRFILLIAAIVLIFGVQSFAHAANLSDYTLPVYNVEVSPENLAYLIENWRSEEFFPAVIEYNGLQYSGEFGLRGATSRKLSKKSFQFRFSVPGPDGATEVNLNSEYRDISLSRNCLAMILAKRLDLPAPKVRHVSLVINGDYFGVYNEIEEVDDLFFNSRDMEIPTFLVRSIRHGGAFTPILDPTVFNTLYNLNTTTPAGLDTFAVRRMLYQFGDRTTVALHSSRILNLENILAYFALQFAITNLDGMTKNFFLFDDPSGRYSMIPWDCDATFGNAWTGDWTPNYMSLRFYMPLEQAPLFVRAMEQDHLKAGFREYLDRISTNDFAALQEDVDSIYESIRHDVELDTLRNGSLADFDLAFERLHQFLDERSEVLEDNDILSQTYVEDYHVTFVDHEDDDEGETKILFTATIPGNPRVAQVWIGDVYPFDVYEMNDDGDDGDEIAGDDVWSYEYEHETEEEVLYFYFATRELLNIQHKFPPSGHLYFDRDPCRILSFPTQRENVPFPGELAFGTSYESEPERSRLISIVNQSDRTISLAGVHLVLDSPQNQISLSNCDDLLVGDTLFIASDPDLERGRAPWRIIFGPSPLYADDVDELKLILFDETVLDSAPMSPESVSEQIGPGVINEICYHPLEMLDCGDWVELVFSDTISTIEGWYIRDEREENEYIFTAEDNDKRYYGHDFIVAAEDVNAHAIVYPDLQNVCGPLGFGFSNRGETIRIYDASGLLVDQVRYQDSIPWPAGADGSGRTIELLSPDSANAGPDNWRASLFTDPLGTPGRFNSITDPPPIEPSDPVSDKWMIVGVQPNPSDGHLVVSVNVPERGAFTLSCFNLLGQHLTEKIGWANHAGVLRVGLSLENLASGIYFVLLEEDNGNSVQKVVVLK
jgi:spore coat protein H